MTLNNLFLKNELYLLKNDVIDMLRYKFSFIVKLMG